MKQQENEATFGLTPKRLTDLIADLKEGKESFVFGCTDIDSLLEFLQDNQGIEFEYSFKNNGVQIIPSESDFD